jgi:phosphomannomutase
MGKEVRPQTDQMLELEARMMAAEDITVITTEKFTDTTNIYLNSFLCFLLGSDGGTYYTPSHSSVYILGRKALAADGAQLLPEVYDRFIQILVSIYQQAAQKGYDVEIAERSHPNILNTLSYARVADLFARVLNPGREAIAEINQAAQDGLRIILNTLSGSAAKSLAAQFSALGIDQKIFKPLWAKEDSFFNAGYEVIDKDGRFLVDHVGVDTSAPQIVQRIPYADVLKDAKVGTLVYECDPDNDRLVVKQVLPESSRALCEAFGIRVYTLGKGRILAAPSPNKTLRRSKAILPLFSAALDLRTSMALWPRSRIGGLTGRRSRH